MAWLQERRLAIYAARVDGSVDYTACDFTAGCAIALGSEAEGLTNAWHGSGVTAIRLPMLGVPTVLMFPLPQPCCSMRCAGSAHRATTARRLHNLNPAAGHLAEDRNQGRLEDHRDGRGRQEARRGRGRHDHRDRPAHRDRPGRDHLPIFRCRP